MLGMQNQGPQAVGRDVVRRGWDLKSKIEGLGGSEEGGVLGVGWGEGRGWVVRLECGSEAGNKGWGAKGQVRRAKMKEARSPGAGARV